MSSGTAAKRRVGCGAWARLALAILMALMALAVIYPNTISISSRAIERGHSGSEWGGGPMVMVGYTAVFAIFVICIALGQRRALRLEMVGWLGLFLLLLMTARLS